MPIYEYRCDDCGTQFEELTRGSAAAGAQHTATVTCQRCGSRHATRVLSAFAVHGSTDTPTALEPGPCGSCGAAQRGMCGTD